MEEEELAQKVDDIQEELGNAVEDEAYDIPHVCSQYSNWQPKPMMELKAFCSAIDVHKPNFLEELQCTEQIRNTGIATLDDLNVKEKNLLKEAED